MLPYMCLVGLEHAPPSPVFLRDGFNSMPFAWSESLTAVGCALRELPSVVVLEVDESRSGRFPPQG